MEHKETGCQSPPEAPILCANNCGFFGSSATMNLCSKCHKDLVLKREQANLAASSIRSIMNGSSSNSHESILATALDAQASPPSSMAILKPVASPDSNSESGNEKLKAGPNRCGTCRKRVGLTGFNCRCGNVFCAAHRYSDKHECPFDYKAAGQDAIAKANPVVKAEKLGKI